MVRSVPTVTVGPASRNKVGRTKPRMTFRQTDSAESSVRTGSESSERAVGIVATVTVQVAHRKDVRKTEQVGIVAVVLVVIAQVLVLVAISPVCYVRRLSNRRARDKV